MLGVPLKQKRSFSENIKTYYPISATAHTLGLLNSVSKSCGGLLHTQGRIKSVFLENIPARRGYLGIYPRGQGAFAPAPLLTGWDGDQSTYG